MSTEKIKKELVWIRQFIHKKDDENVVIRDANGKDIASWIDRVDAAIATPPAAQTAQRKPLTDAEIEHLLETRVGTPSPSYPLEKSDWMQFARAIEAAHGIKEKNTWTKMMHYAWRWIGMTVGMKIAMNSKR